jgi:hypothetical protein
LPLVIGAPLRDDVRTFRIFDILKTIAEAGADIPNTVRLTPRTESALEYASKWREAA